MKGLSSNQLSRAGSNNNMGSSVALSEDGNRVVFGGPSFTNGRGLTMSYEYNPYTLLWSQRGSAFEGEQNNDFSGNSVAISRDGNFWIRGAFMNTAPSGEKSGSARVYRWTGTDWAMMGVDIDANDLLARFGSSVAMALDGLVVAMGGPYDEPTTDVSDNRGSVRVYTWHASENKWKLRGFEINGEAPLDLSGTSVSLSYNASRLAIGAINNKPDGINKKGHVRIYEYVDVCPPGSFSANGALPCTLCPIGSTSTARRGSTSCTSCPAGKYASSPSEGAQSCLSCEQGTYSSQTGASDVSTCVACQHGLYPSTDRSACFPCNYDTYEGPTSSSSKNVFDCITCPEGKRTVQTGSFGVDSCKKSTR